MTNNRPSRDQTDLSALYPTPKTYEERKADQEAREARRLARKPHHAFLSTCFRLYSILIALALGTYAILALIQTASISGIFLSFLVGLMWFGYATWMAHAISDTLSRLVFSAVPLLVSYVCLYPLAVFGILQFVDASSTAIFFTVATIVHFILTPLLMAFLYKTH